MNNSFIMTTPNEKKPILSSNIARAALRGTLLTFALRLLNFFLSQVTLRLVDIRTLGQTSIQLELLLNSCLFLSRECFRLAFMSVDATIYGDDDKDKKHLENVSLNNLSWLSAIVGVVMSLIGLGIYVISMSLTDFSNYDLLIAGCLYSFGAVLESLSEPMLLLTIRNMDVDKRLSAEGAALFVKALSTSLFLYTMKDISPATSFGLAQVSYGLTIMIVLYRQTRNQLQWPKSALSKAAENNTLILWIGSIPLHRSTLIMIGTFSIQGVFKHLLTEGDKIVLSFTADNYDQGVYAMVCAYGGLASRLLLQPLEENGRYFFAQMNKSRLKKDGNDELRSAYTMLIKLVLYIGFLFACVAVNYSNIVLRLLAGSKWANSDASNALAAFCCYTSFLALNGMTEAFVYGLASSSSDIRNISIAHAIIGCVYGLLSFYLTAWYGTVGLIAANSVQMLLRSLYSINFADKYFRSHCENIHQQPRYVSLYELIRDFTPSVVSAIMFCITFILTSQSNNYFLLQSSYQNSKSLSTHWILAATKHILCGITCLLFMCPVVYYQERRAREYLSSLKKLKRD